MVRRDEVGADGRQRFTRLQAAKYLGRSVTTIRRWQKDGLLVGVTVEGTAVFTVTELDAMRSYGTGHDAGQAFDLFAEGKGAIEVVRELKYPPDVAMSMWESWQTMSRVFVIEAPPCSRVEWERVYSCALPSRKSDPRPQHPQNTYLLTPRRLLKVLELVSTSEDMMRIIESTEP